MPKCCRHGECCLASTDGTIWIVVVINVEDNLLSAVMVLQSNGAFNYVQTCTGA
jgi:hypothetical protein